MEHRHLSGLYRDIDVSEAELEASRARLQRSVSQGEQAQGMPWVRRMKKLLPVPEIWSPSLRLAVPVAASLLLAVMFVQIFRPGGLESFELAELEAFVARHGDHSSLYRKAQALQQSASDMERLNGLYILSALGSEEENILASAQGLLEDPRPEFRAYYLDYLITYADEAYYDIDYLEALMDRESDPECLLLFEELLQIVSRYLSDGSAASALHRSSRQMRA